MQSLHRPQLALLGFLLALATGVSAQSSYRLRLVHVNDIHAHLDPSDVTLSGEPSLQVQMGGAARLATAFAQLRKEPVPTLFLHAGDQFSGTSWFSHYQGLADAAALDRLGFDAFVPGNHEFDKGPAVLGRFLDSLDAPALAANLDVDQEPALRGKIAPGLIRSIAGHRIGIVGAAQPETPRISSPGPLVRFRSVRSVRPTVDSLRKAGAEVVILLSHAGFEEDTLLACRLGVDAVVGGHSHTRMGDFSQEGLKGSSAYPAVARCADGRRVPVVQAWEWGKEIGVLDLEIAQGKVTGFQGRPFLPMGGTFREEGKLVPDKQAVAIGKRLEQRKAVRILEADSAMQALLDRLGKPLDSLRKAVVGHLPEGISRRHGALVQVCAASLLQAGEVHGARVGLVNAGGVRDDLKGGVVTQDDVLKVQPFGNAVVILTVTGKELLNAVKILNGRHGRTVGLAGVAIVTDSVRSSIALRWITVAASCVSCKDAQTQMSAKLVGESDTVRIATSSYLAGGGDGCQVLKASQGWRQEMDLTDAQALVAWIRKWHP
ncbi:MAG: hypothetical protein RL318_2770 [Fibrobacterota bacterium]